MTRSYWASLESRGFYYASWDNTDPDELAYEVADALPGVAPLAVRNLTDSADNLRHHKVNVMETPYGNLHVYILDEGD